MMPSGLLNVSQASANSAATPSVLVKGVPSIASAIASDGNGLLDVGVGDARRRLCQQWRLFFSAITMRTRSAAATGASGIDRARCELSIGCPSDPDRGDRGCEASESREEPDEHAQECPNDAVRSSSVA
jgi:hypothetical protein